MDYKFSPSQAKHAQAVAIGLYKRCRFFLPRAATTEEPLPFLSADVFKELYKLEKMFSDEYHFTRAKAEVELINFEHSYGLKMPELKVGQSIVDCNRYTGGLEIVAMVPISALMMSLPEQEEISEELLEAHFPIKERGGVTPDAVTMHREIFDKYAMKVFSEYIELSRQDDYTNKVVTFLDTKFAPGSYQDDFMLGKVEGLVTYPHLTSYLLFKAGLKGLKFTAKPFTIFTSSRYGHIAIDNQDNPHSLLIGQRGGYDCLVSFATIL